MSKRDLMLVRERKAFLSTQAAVDRMRVTLATVELRTAIAPTRESNSATGGRPIASVLVAVAAPIFGMPRLARYARVASLVMMAWRIARNWDRRTAR